MIQFVVLIRRVKMFNSVASNWFTEKKKILLHIVFKVPHLNF